MNTNLLHPKAGALAFAAIAVIVMGAAGAVGVASSGWLRTASPDDIEMSAQDQAGEAGPADEPVSRASRRKAACDECGVIESTRRIAPVGSAPAVFEITVRLGDGTTRVLSDASPASWRPGERTILIEGWTKPGT